MILAVDFDGTCVYHEYPSVGKDVPNAVETLKRWADNGHKLILWTMRSGSTLSDAVQWFVTRNIPLYGINKNPTQESWTSSPKAYAQVYIDDAAVGCPLLYGDDPNAPPFVDWLKVDALLFG